MMANADSHRVDDLLASLTEGMLGDLPQVLHDQSIRVERILLELVRPDPVQPRRVLLEAIHFDFHSNRLTPTQALKELGAPLQNPLRAADARAATGQSPSPPEVRPPP